jgi:hypothetical protein
VNLRVNSPAGQNNTAAEMTRVKALTSKMLLAELVYTLTGTNDPRAIPPDKILTCVQLTQFSSWQTSG